MDYNELYNTDQRFRRYVDACSKDYGLTREEMLQNKIIQNVGEYYAKTPTKEGSTVSTMKSGGC